MLIPKEKIGLWVGSLAAFWAAGGGRPASLATKRTTGPKICNFLSGMVYIFESVEEGSFQ